MFLTKTERDNRVYCKINLTILAEMANAIGSLKTYEANVREADPTLLHAGNHSVVPSIDAIRTAKSNYNKDHRFDNDPVKDLLIFQEALIVADKTSKIVKGMRNSFVFIFTLLYYLYRLYTRRSTNTIRCSLYIRSSHPAVLSILQNCNVFIHSY
jgi:hypothetical protein